MALLALLALGLAGTFDPTEDDVSASGGGTKLTATFPERARAGLDSPLELTVERVAGFDGPIEVAISSDWLSMFNLNAMEPELAGATADGDRVIWEYDPPPGETLEITADLTLRPAIRAGKSARVAVLEDDAEVVTVEFDTGVIP